MRPRASAAVVRPGGAARGAREFFCRFQSSRRPTGTSMPQPPLFHFLASRLRDAGLSGGGQWGRRQRLRRCWACPPPPAKLDSGRAFEESMLFPLWCPPGAGSPPSMQPCVCFLCVSERQLVTHHAAQTVCELSPAFARLLIDVLKSLACSPPYLALLASFWLMLDCPCVTCCRLAAAVCLNDHHIVRRHLTLSAWLVVGQLDSCTQVHVIHG